MQTVDFFPPIVDDPYDFGQIAAANALSDIYAMGGKPLTALNIVAFPASTMAPEILSRILLGGAEKIREAGAVVVGGHSIKDKELKYGVAVTGIIETDAIIKNVGAKVGDQLYLTKPLGTGIISTAIKHGSASPEAISAVTAMMKQLNKTASELMVKHGAHAATDITGYGLLGHAYEMASGSGVSFVFNSASLPLLPEVLKYAEAGHLTGGANANREYLADKVELSQSVAEALTHVLFDAQTSGGLLIAVSPDSGERMMKEAQSLGATVWRIGEVVKRRDYRDHGCLAITPSA